jgi:ABC-type transport system involved in cytochrome bd biosynthesis fused ATPase/permease subunit
MLFNRSVRDNIALANPAMSMEQIIAAASLAGPMNSFCNSPRATTRSSASAAATCPVVSVNASQLLARSSPTLAS